MATGKSTFGWRILSQVRSDSMVSMASWLANKYAS